MTKKYTLGTLISEVCMIALCAVFFIPVYYLVVSTFKTQSDIIKSPLALPAGFNFDNYIRALDTMSFWRNFGNSFFITSLSIVFIILFGSTAAYAIVRRKNKLMKFIGAYFTIGFMVPIQTTMLPLFVIMKNLGLINTFVGMIFLHSNGCIFASFLYRGFIKSLPVELEEAAIIDGAGLVRTFSKIVFPLLKPVTATLIIFNVMWIWNDFMLTYLFLSASKKATLIMQVYNGIGLYSNDWGVMMPVLVLALLPMVIFYLLMQRHIIGGLTSGSLKG